MESIELGRRLRVARKAQGLSQQAVAKELGLTRTAITQMEAGKRSVSTLELTKLSRLYVRPVTDFLQENSWSEDKDALLVLYRVAPGLEQDASTHYQVTRCINLCREGVRLKRMLGAVVRFALPSYEIRVPRSSREAIEQGEQVAVEERRRLGIGNAPIANASELIASQGIWASGVNLPDDMSGLFLQHPSIGLAVLVNASHPKGRKRFSYAHEYAHVLLDRDRKITVSMRDNSSKKTEQRANAFAAALLMPREGVYDVLRNFDKGLSRCQEQTVFDVASGSHIEAVFRSPSGSQRFNCKDVARLAHHFGVGYQVALYRIKSLQYISKTESQELLEQEGLGCEYLKAFDMFDDVGELEKHKYWDRELRSEIAHLAIETYCRGEISCGRLLDLSEMLGVDSDILLQVAEARLGA